MTIIDGQLDALDLLTAEPAREYKLPFTVFSGPFKFNQAECAYCGTKRNINEWYAGPATPEHPNYNFGICEPCSERNRGMRPPPDLWTFRESP